MSPKHLPRDRAWGTRYDTLNLSPPSSPPVPRAHSPDTTHTALLPNATQNRSLASRDQKSFSTPHTVIEGPNPQHSAPHDASIFVGSLPASLEHGDLTQRLIDHLSSYPQIKTIKVVRDSRGGVCAFVQCETPSAAGDLLQTLHANPPRPFLGRSLRFEPAKAFRTLLISYRAPPGYISTQAEGRPASIKLASAMRVFRPRSGKHLGILYDTDAITYSSNIDDPHHDAFSGNGLFFHPLKYDMETMRTLVESFGPLESFEKHPEQTGEPSLTGSVAVPPVPHDAPRTPDMDPGVWEVKWKDREHSVAALLTLRRVPHLTISWAHHPAVNTAIDLRQSNLLSSPSPWVSPGLRPFNSPPTPLSLGGPLILRMPAARGSHAFSSPTPSPKNESAGWSTVESPTLTMRSDRTTKSSTRWADQVTDFYEGHGVSSSTLRTYAPADGTLGDTSQSGTTEIASPITESRYRPYYPMTPKCDRDFSCAVDSIASISGQQTPERFQGGGQLDRNTVNPIPTDRHKEIDPSSIYVGGFDLKSPERAERDALPHHAEWDEDTLREIFNRFGSIETIQMVRPPYNPAYAFVKFTSPEAASRAVQEEDNQVHDGRPIRVQLRLRNAAPRGTWRGRGRGRGSYGPMQYGRRPFTVGTAAAFHDGGFRGTSSPVVSQAHFATPSWFPAADAERSSQWDEHEPGFLTENALHGRQLQEAATNSVSSISSSTTKVPSLRYDISNGAISTDASPTPVSSSSVSTPVSALGPAPPYPMNMSYFPSQPWVQPYTPPYPYAVPMVPGYGYPGYNYPTMQFVPSPFYARDVGLDSMSHITGHAVPIAAGDNTYKEPGNPENRNPAALNQFAPQPPLRATGFRQNEHGALIPVYQREALDQYMASAYGGQGLPSQPQTPSQSAMPFASSSGIPWHQVHAMPSHQGGYTPNVPFIPQAPSGPPGQQQFWVPCPVPYGFTAPTQNAPTTLSPTILAPATHAGRPYEPGQRGGPPPRRSTRRDRYNASGTTENSLHSGVGRQSSSRIVVTDSRSNRLT